jgi:type VI secretion system secreted protein Hcp
MAIFMKIDGIAGEAKAVGYDAWIAVDSYSWNTSRSLYTQTGQSQDREGTLATIGDLSISKRMDVTSPAIFQESVVGKSKTVLLHVTKQGSGGPEVYMEYTLTNAMISSYSVGGTGDEGGGRPSEAISFNFTKVEVKYTPYDDAHNAGTPVPAGFDVETGNKV